jgi:hypothetical protein
VAAVNVEEIELAHEAACRLAREENDGMLDTVTEMALDQMAAWLLESLVAEAERFKKSAEGRLLRGEEALAKYSHDSPESVEDDANMFTGDAA